MTHSFCHSIYLLFSTLQNYKKIIQPYIQYLLRYSPDRRIPLGYSIPGIQQYQQQEVIILLLLVTNTTTALESDTAVCCCSVLSGVNWRYARADLFEGLKFSKMS
mgnify:CR=1 FL=1